jgi:two-component system NtrC family sensor kinase
VKLLPKFALLSLGVAAVPLAIAGLSSARISQQELREAIKDQEALVAADVSNFVAMRIGHLMDVLAAQSRVLSGTQPSARLLPGFLTLIYHQSDDFTAVFALDAQGKQLASIFQDTPSGDPAILGNHELVKPGEVARAVGLIPLATVLKLGATAGPVLSRAAQPGTPAAPALNTQLVLAVRYQPRGDQPALIFGALVGLRRIAQHMASLTSDGREVFLLDRDGTVVASGRGSGTPTFTSNPMSAFQTGGLPQRPQVITTETGRVVFGAVAGVPALGFGVLVERPFGQSLSPMRRLGLSTLFWIGVSSCVAALIGGALARSLSGRVGALAQGARRIAQGNLDTKFEVDSEDELGELGKAFNAMTTSLSAARHEILRQTEEITAWNETLERRVADKSAELVHTQDLLLRSRSLAAIGSLGAGVAHEINNPLTGILGLAQLLLSDLPADHPARTLIKDIEGEALRIESIVTNLLRLAQRQAGEEQRTIDLATIVDDALELCGEKSFRDAGITITRRIPSPSPPVRGNATQLQAALIHLIQNARAAMLGSGGWLTLETSVPEAGLLRLKVSDTGVGIDAEHLPRIFDPFFTTKARHADTGIGLSVVHKIIEDHGGNIRVDSQLGVGTTFAITLPIDAGGAHLA